MESTLIDKIFIMNAGFSLGISMLTGLMFTEYAKQNLLGKIGYLGIMIIAALHLN